MNYRIAKNCSIEKVGEEVAVTCPTGDVMVLNETAGLILTALSEGLSERDIITCLEENYDIAHETTSFKVSETLRVLQEHGIVVSAQQKPKIEKVIAKPKSVSRRGFASAAGIIGISLFAPSAMQTEESRAFAHEFLEGDSLGGWGAEQKVARIWTDSLGRMVEVPEQVTKVAPYGPYAQAMLESIDPALVVPVNNRGLHASASQSLRTVSSSMTNTAILDTAVLKREAPDVVVDMADCPERLTSTIDPAQDESEVPIVHIVTGVGELPKAYRMLGDFLDIPKAYELADYAAQILYTFEQGRSLIDANGRKSVYFGQGEYGLDTRSKNTMLDDVLEMIGADNVAKGLEPGECYGIDPARIAEWNPDMVLLSILDIEYGTERGNVIFGLWGEDGLLGSNCRVVVAPTRPYPWLDRSPLFMQTLGALFVANALYPDIYSYDMAGTTRDYFRMFFNRSLKKSRAEAMIAAAHLKAPDPVTV
jgi:iron complex transport system substrate-binding protein